MLRWRMVAQTFELFLFWWLLLRDIVKKELIVREAFLVSDA